jgi:hypothetical protein
MDFGFETRTTMKSFANSLSKTPFFGPPPRIDPPYLGDFITVNILHGMPYRASFQIFTDI